MQGYGMLTALFPRGRRGLPFTSTEYVEGRVARPRFGFRYDKYPKSRNSFLVDLLYK